MGHAFDAGRVFRYAPLTMFPTTEATMTIDTDQHGPLCYASDPQRRTAYRLAMQYRDDHGHKRLPRATWETDADGIATVQIVSRGKVMVEARVSRDGVVLSTAA